MAYNQRRVVNTQRGGNQARTVSYSGGLNERFSTLEKKKSAQGGQFGNSNSGGSAAGGTVFSRLRGGKTAIAKGRVNAIQNRLGKTKTGGIKKNVGKNVKGGNTAATKNSGRGRKGAVSKPGAKKAARNPKEKKKPMTAEDLDKQMDAYMMKDKKSAQAKLDDELNSYMADAPAIDLEELS